LSAACCVVMSPPNWIITARLCRLLSDHWPSILIRPTRPRRTIPLQRLVDCRHRSPTTWSVYQLTLNDGDRTNNLAEAWRGTAGSNACRSINQNACIAPPCVANESYLQDGMSNSSVFKVRAKVLKSLQDLQLNGREFQTVGRCKGCSHGSSETGSLGLFWTASL